MLSPNQAALKAGVSRKTIMNHIRSQSLKATRNNHNQWSIRPTDLAVWMQERERQSHPSPTSPTNETTTANPTASPTAIEIELSISRIEYAYAQKETELLAQRVKQLEQEAVANREHVAGLLDTIKDLSTLLASDRGSYTENIFLEDEPLVLPSSFKVKKEQE